MRGFLPLRNTTANRQDERRPRSDAGPLTFIHRYLKGLQEVGRQPDGVFDRDLYEERRYVVYGARLAYGGSIPLGSLPIGSLVSR